MGGITERVHKVISPDYARDIAKTHVSDVAALRGKLTAATSAAAEMDNKINAVHHILDEVRATGCDDLVYRVRIYVEKSVSARDAILRQLDETRARLADMERNAQQKAIEQSWRDRNCDNCERAGSPCEEHRLACLREMTTAIRADVSGAATSAPTEPASPRTLPLDRGVEEQATRDKEREIEELMGGTVVVYARLSKLLFTIKDCALALRAAIAEGDSQERVSLAHRWLRDALDSYESVQGSAEKIRRSVVFVSVPTTPPDPPAEMPVPITETDACSKCHDALAQVNDGDDHI